MNASPLKLRLLVAAAAMVGLTLPLAARANHDDGTMELLASAATAYVLIDVAGGFDNRKHDRHRHHDYRPIYRSHHRHDWRHDHRWCNGKGHAYGHSKHGKHDARHWDGYRDHHRRHDGRRDDRWGHDRDDRHRVRAFH